LFELAERLGRTVFGVYDEGDPERLLEPGIVHMNLKEFRHWKQYSSRLAEEARMNALRSK
jgi:hypothetical protein